MSQEKGHLAELISSLKRQRDELALKIHLGKADAKEEWNKITKKLDDLTRDYEPLKDAVGETAENRPGRTETRDRGDSERLQSHPQVTLA